MDICLEMVISYLFLFLAFIIGQNVSAEESRCGTHGPIIQFPFRLNSQPDDCRYPGFNISCTTDTNQTVLELPISVTLFVKEINYTSQVIQLYNPPHHCFPTQLQRLNLSSSPSPFQFPHYRRDYALFNCSKRATMNYSGWIPCLSGPTYHVYAFDDGMSIAELPLSCTKMYNLLSIPYDISLIDGSDNNVLKLEWGPVRGYCEAKGMKCRLKKNSTKSETECFPKGIVFQPLYSISSRFSSQHALIAPQQRRISCIHSCSRMVTIVYRLNLTEGSSRT